MAQTLSMIASTRELGTGSLFDPRDEFYRSRIVLSRVELDLEGGSARYFGWALPDVLNAPLKAISPHYKSTKQNQSVIFRTFPVFLKVLK